MQPIGTKTEFSTSAQPLTKMLWVALCATAFLIAASPAQADTQAKRNPQSTVAPAPKSHPSISFPNKSKGAEAFKRLKASGKLPEWAQYYDLKQADVQPLFEKDPTARLDEAGRLHYIEPASTAGGDFSAAQTNISADQTFLLNSSPNSTKTIYLDFNGHVTSNTAWNTSYGISSINSPAYDMDNVPGSFNATELTNIQTIWKMVAEDYAGLDVNVTTQEPLLEKLTRSSSTDNVFGVRVVITKDFTASTSRPCQCGGFAYVGVFPSTSEAYKPAFVFHNNLGNAKNVAEATSHEAGHTLGLSHDGTTSTGYYSGHGTGETSWAPIMGVGYGKNLVQWSKGEYANANQQQDDYLVMQGRGVPFDLDEHGDSISTATALSGGVVNGFEQYKATGILQGPNDSDYVSFSGNAGAISIDVKPLSANLGNADILITLLDAQNNVLAQSNAIETLGTSLTFNLPEQGTYILKVEGSGKGDPLATGYTKYGSVGYWSALINAQATSGNLSPTAQISADKITGTAPLVINFSALASTDPEGSALSYHWDFGDGTNATGPTITKTYQSAGNYTASVRVTDTGGLSSSASVSINVTAPVSQVVMSVFNISMDGMHRKVQRSATATVTIQDDKGIPVSGATVSGNWSGAVSGQLTGTTGTDGRIIFKSPNAKKSGTFTFTVKAVNKSEFVYDPALNVMTSNSVTVQ
ncbi:MAG: PKD domain-containing protein [Limnobacter sp.]|uniref:PKD domain-containing protein n=1 Tax=Limnobacter sp. TaxID=2003368 RepID=UPI0032EDEA2E